MNTEEHASSILAAWQFSDKSSLEKALNRALVFSTNSRAISSLESERREILQSIAEHLRTATGDGSVPDYSGGNGALTLLFHLSAGLYRKEAPDAHFKNYGRKILKFGGKGSKCFTEVECRPRG